MAKLYQQRLARKRAALPLQRLNETTHNPVARPNSTTHACGAQRRNARAFFAW
jgi:hypothetical protein